VYRRNIAGILSLYLFVQGGVSVQAAEPPKEAELYAKSAVLMDADSGRVLYEKNGYEKHYPASLTKMMTAILAVEYADMTSSVTFSETAVALEYGASHIGVTAGEVLSMNDCMYALLLASANECANGIAESISGSIAAFGQLMTQRAAALGALNTNFTNPSGLHDDAHYTTAYDMALIAREFLNHSELLEIETVLDYTIGETNLVDETRTFQQKHNMAYSGNQYFYEDGTFLAGKTGYTDASGTTLVTCVEKNDMRLIAVLFQANGKHAYVDTSTLFNYGFENYANVAMNDLKSVYVDKQGILAAVKSKFGLIADDIHYDETTAALLPIDYNAAYITTNTLFEETLDENSGLIGTFLIQYNRQIVQSIPLYIDIKDAKPVVPANQIVTQNTTAKKSPGVPTALIVVLVIVVIFGICIGFLQARATRLRKQKLSHRRQQRSRMAVSYKK